MTWTLAVTFHLVFVAFTTYFIKSGVNKLPNAKFLSWQFLISAGLIWIVVLSTGEIEFKQFFFWIMMVGFINAFGAYCQWNAYEFNLSRTVLFIPLVDILAVGLAALFLGEVLIYRSPFLIAGVFLLFSAAFLLSRREKGRGEIKKKWLVLILGMVLIQGGAVFMLKFFSFTVPRLIFLTYWYSGSFLGSLPVVWFRRKKEGKLFSKEAWLIPATSVGILGGMFFIYWALQLGPAGVVLPIRNFWIVSIPLIIGWLLFHERRGLTKLQILGFGLGILGVSSTIIGQL